MEKLVIDNFGRAFFKIYLVFFVFFLQILKLTESENVRNLKTTFYFIRFKDFNIKLT